METSTGSLFLGISHSFRPMHFFHKKYFRKIELMSILKTPTTGRKKFLIELLNLAAKSMIKMPFFCVKVNPENNKITFIAINGDWEKD